MEQVAVFSHMRSDKLAEVVNSWLQENQDVEITSRLVHTALGTFHELGQSVATYTIAIFYRTSKAAEE